MKVYAVNWPDDTTTVYASKNDAVLELIWRPDWERDWAWTSGILMHPRDVPHDAVWTDGAKEVRGE